jgi:hypothetical protein
MTFTADRDLLRLQTEYYVAVAHHSVDADILTNDEKSEHLLRRRLLLSDGEYFDFFTFVHAKTTVGTKLKLIEPDHFHTEGKVNKHQALKRCLYLGLSNPERFVPIAQDEIHSDRLKATDWQKQCIQHLMVRVSNIYGITYGSTPRKRIHSCSNIGIALTECKDSPDFEALWEVLYGEFDRLSYWKFRLEEACLVQCDWKYDPALIRLTGNQLGCVSRLVSSTLNGLRRTINGFATRKQLPTISIKRPRSMIDATTRWKKREKKHIKLIL